MAEPLPVQLLLGLYLGVLTGVLPALIAWALGFSFRYVTGVTLPGFAVVVLGTALAGISGGLMGLLDPAVAETWVSIVALLVVMMSCLWAHNQGDKMGAEFPRRITLRSLREHTLSRDAVERVGRFGQIRIRINGPIADVEGYPPLPDPVRRTLRAGSWTFPAALTIPELEERLAARLRREYDLADVTVSIDATGRATVAAAPARGGLSKRVPEGKRGVSVETLVPTGLARGDEVRLSASERAIEATVLSVPTVEPPTDGTTDEAEDENGDENGGEEERIDRRATTAVGGEGRVSVAVPARRVPGLLEAGGVELTVHPRGTRREFELVALLRRAGVRFSAVTVAAGSRLAGRAVDGGEMRETYGVALLAVRRPSGRRIAPAEPVEIAAGDELLVAGPADALEGFEEVAA